MFLMHWSFHDVFFHNFPAKTKPQVIIPPCPSKSQREAVKCDETRDKGVLVWSLQCLNMMSIQIATFPADTGHFWFYLESFSRLLYHDLKTIKVCIGRTLLTHTPSTAQRGIDRSRVLNKQSETSDLPGDIGGAGPGAEYSCKLC